VKLFAGADESFAEIVWQRFGIVPAFRPFYILADQPDVNGVLVCEVVSGAP
jgi:hypothetical protein